MDSGTHLLLGATIGQLTMGNKIGKKALLWGAIAGSIPDLDVFIQILLPPANSVLFHRGISHSILFWLILAPLFAYICFKYFNKQGVKYIYWIKLWIIGWFSHLFTDIFNTYGTGYLEPFNNLRVSYDTISVLDIWFVLPFVAAFIMYFAIKDARWYKYIGYSAIIISSLYLGNTIYNKQKVESIVVEKLASENMEYKRIVTSPYPFFNYIWAVTVEVDNGFWLGNCIKKGGDINLQFIPKNEDILAGIEMKELEKIRRFTRGLYTVQQRDNYIILNDIRFSSMNNLYDNEFEFVLKFKIIPEKDRLSIKISPLERRLNFKNMLNYIRLILCKD